jgi:hypothetical protein
MRGLKAMILFGTEDVEVVLEELEQTPSTRAKIAMLRRYKDNTALRAFLDVALNSRRVYHIKRLPEKSSSAINQAALKDIYSLGGLAKYLETRKGLCSEDLDVVFYYFDGLNTELKKKWAEKALLKKAIAGVGVKTVNKAFEEEFLPEHSIMLMHGWKAPLDQLTYPVFVQRKLDGFRCTFIPNIGFLSRKGIPIANTNLPAHFNMGNVLSTRGNVFNDLNSVFDGEVYSHKRSFNDIASILSTVNTPIPDDMKLHVFNIIPMSEWNNQECSGSYTDQLCMFEFLGESLALNNATTIKTYFCKNAEQLKECYNLFLKQGYEGAIIRAPGFVYCWKRATAKSQTIAKLKPEDHIDAKITGVFEGQGNITGMLGGFYIELEDGTALKVGSGFKERERIDFWTKRDSLVGEWVRLQYTEKTPDGSLRFPVFDAIRDSKE